MIVIVGGGLAGLVAAHDLIRAGSPVTVLEAAPRWGGQAWTERSRGFLIEHGAEGYAAGRDSVTELVSELDIAGRLVSQLTTSSLIPRRGQLVPLAAGEAAQLAGIQADRADFGHGIASLKGGVGELVDTLAAAVTRRATIRLGPAALGLATKAAGWEITTNAGDILPAEALVLAAPAAMAAQLVAPVSRNAARMLESFRAVSSVSVSLACPASAVEHPLDAGGFISGAGPGQEGFRACSFASSKFPGRAPEGMVLLRAFFRPGRAFPIDAPDPHWVGLAVNAVWPALGIRAQPVHAWVARWPRALPRYSPNHDEASRAIAQLLGGGAPLVLAGAAYRGSGIAGAIESARTAARSLLAARA